MGEGKRARAVMVAAVAENGAIGSGGKLPWRLPEDIRRFREEIRGKALILGRETWEGIRRFLPGQRIIAISRREGFAPEGAEAAGSLEEALERCRGEEEAIIGGGGKIYEEGMRVADELRITHVRASVAGDAFFPRIDPRVWEEIRRERLPKGGPAEPDCDWVAYRRKGAEDGEGGGGGNG